MTVLNTSDKIMFAGHEPDTVYLDATKVWQKPSTGPPVTAGMTVRLDASQLGLANGAPVTIWPDLSGSGNDGIPQNGGYPTLLAAALKGQPVVRFVGQGQSGIGDGSIYNTNGLTGINFTVSYIVRQWGPNFGRAYGAVLADANFVGGLHSSGYDLCYGDGGWQAAGTPWPTTPVLPAPWKLYTISGYPGDMWVNGTHVGGPWPYGGTPPGAGVGTHYILSGYDTVGHETADIDVAEFLMYNRKLTDTERGDLETYLTTKWLA
jgi:hypothetical protein